MEELYTLAYYGTSERGYHIHRIKSSVSDGQLHYHKHYQVGIVLSGTLKHRQSRKYANLKPGDAFIIPPGYPHSLHFNGETEIYSLCFDESLIPQSMIEGGLRQFLNGLQNETPETRVLLRIIPERWQSEALRALMDVLLAQQKVKHLPELSCVPGAVCAILNLLAQAYYAMPLNVAVLEVMTGYNSNIRRCIRYVDEHFREKLSAEALARQFGMSRAALCGAFPQYAGMSIHKYIIRKRILEAQLQIRTKPGLPISQVAQEVGYEDESTFYRNFRRLTGMSPADYRCRCREEENSAYGVVIDYHD